MKWLAKSTLHYPMLLGTICVALSVAVGALLQYLFGGNHFQRAGNLTLLVGLLTFGSVVADFFMTNGLRGWTNSDGDYDFPYSRNNMSKVLGAEAVIVAVASIQSGYGDLIVRSIKC